jgi:hypothetical protein
MKILSIMVIKNYIVGNAYIYIYIYIYVCVYVSTLLVCLSVCLFINYYIYYNVLSKRINTKETITLCTVLYGHGS